MFTFSPVLSNSVAFAFRRIVFPVPKDDMNASLLLRAVVLIKLSCTRLQKKIFSGTELDLEEFCCKQFILVDLTSLDKYYG